MHQLHQTSFTVIGTNLQYNKQIKGSCIRCNQTFWNKPNNHSLTMFYYFVPARASCSGQTPFFGPNHGTLHSSMRDSHWLRFVEGKVASCTWCHTAHCRDHVNDSAWNQRRGSGLNCLRWNPTHRKCRLMRAVNTHTHVWLIQPSPSH